MGNVNSRSQRYLVFFKSLLLLLLFVTVLGGLLTLGNCYTTYVTDMSYPQISMDIRGADIRG